MAETDENERRHPEVLRKKRYPAWPADKPFPLTPLEAWYVLQGWQVSPANGITIEQINELPGKIEGDGGWVWLWQS